MFTKLTCGNKSVEVIKQGDILCKSRQTIQYTVSEEFRI